MNIHIQRIFDPGDTPVYIRLFFDEADVENIKSTGHIDLLITDLSELTKKPLVIALKAKSPG